MITLGKPMKKILFVALMLTGCNNMGPSSDQYAEYAKIWVDKRVNVCIDGVEYMALTGYGSTITLTRHDHTNGLPYLCNAPSPSRPTVVAAPINN